MHRIAASILAAGLIAATGAASAQNAGYASPVDDRYAEADAPYYDYARVLRVDPVLPSGYRSTRTSSNECYSEDGYYTDNGNDGRYDDRYSDRDDQSGSRYESRDGRYDNEYGTRTGRNVATVIGGIVGAALGSKVGGGSARYATAAVGSMVGGMAGREIYDQSQRDRYTRPATVRVCDPEPVRGNGYGSYRTGNANAYDVTYEYNGRRYTRRMDYHPGERVRVRVDVSPQ